MACTGGAEGSPTPGGAEIGCCSRGRHLWCCSFCLLSANSKRCGSSSWQLCCSLLGHQPACHCSLSILIQMCCRQNMMKIVLGLHLRKETVPYKTCEEKEIVIPWEQGSHDFATKKILCFFELVFKYAFHLLMVLPSPTKMYV